MEVQALGALGPDGRGMAPEDTVVRPRRPSPTHQGDPCPLEASVPTRRTQSRTVGHLGDILPPGASEVFLSVREGQHSSAPVFWAEAAGDAPVCR